MHSYDFSHQVQTAVGYEGTPDDIASIVSYLVSKEAHFITGEFRLPVTVWTNMHQGLLDILSWMLYRAERKCTSTVTELECCWTCHWLFRHRFLQMEDSSSLRLWHEEIFFEALWETKKPCTGWNYSRELSSLKVEDNPNCDLSRTSCDPRLKIIDYLVWSRMIGMIGFSVGLSKKIRYGLALLKGWTPTNLLQYLPLLETILKSTSLFHHNPLNFIRYASSILRRRKFQDEPHLPGSKGIYHQCP